MPSHTTPLSPPLVPPSFLAPATGSPCAALPRSRPLTADDSGEPPHAPSPAAPAAAFALITVAALALTVCGSGDPASAPADAAGDGAARGKVPTTDVVSSVRKDEAAAKLLPAGVRLAGTLDIAAAVSNPPGATYLADGRTVAGTDIDFADAVARKLGLRFTREVALKADGTYDRILKKWGIGASAIRTSQISPPEIK